jgi:serine/threonine protein kinase
MALQAGQLFGNYRVVRLLGEGGFGEVYLVENPLIQRRAAVKVLHTALTRDAELVRRFLNEARAASAIRHPNIIDVFDAGEMPDRAPYILMEFLEGESLHKRLFGCGRIKRLLVRPMSPCPAASLERRKPGRFGFGCCSRGWHRSPRFETREPVPGARRGRAR